MENSEQKVKIRKATYEDLEPICDIYTQAFNGKTNPSNRQWWNILDNPNIHYYVAEEGGYVVGVASLITINKLISKPLKEKLRHDAQQLNFMKKTSRAKLMLV